MQHVVMPEEMSAERRRLGLDKQDEMWDGVLHLNSPGNTNHQRIEGKLAPCLAPLAEELDLERLAETGLFDPTVQENKSFWVPDVVVFPPAVASDRRTVRRWIRSAGVLTEVPGCEDGWHQPAALPVGTRGGGGSLEVRIGDRVEVI